MPFYLAQRDATQHITLYQYLPDSFISAHITKLAHLDFMWRVYRRRLIWHVISRVTALEWAAAYAYRRSIKWRVFLATRLVPLSISQLVSISTYVKQLSDLFRGNSKIAALYYDDEFCAKFPGLVNWRLAVQLPSVSQDTVRSAWQRIPISWIIDAGRLDCQMVECYGRRMNWSVACDKPMALAVISAHKDRVLWGKVVRNTPLSPALIRYAMRRVPLESIVSSQQLGKAMIVEFIDKWPMAAVSAAQKLSAVEIYELAEVLHAAHLAVNPWTRAVVLHAAGREYYLIVTKNEAEQIVQQWGPITARTCACQATLRVAIMC